nr:sensor histidine kinase [Acanthopleuribacter pedis]
MRERNRLARDIHDSLGHYLTAVNMQAAAAAAVLPTKPEQSAAMLSQIQDMAKRGLREVRGSVAGLREDPVTGKSPTEFLTELAEITRRQGVVVNLSIQEGIHVLPPVLNQVVYRAAQESLTNVRKYADADTVWLELRADAATLTFTCRDNGRGAETLSGGFGLTGLRERAKMVGGEVQFATAPGQGFTVTLCCPLAETERQGEAP